MFLREKKLTQISEVIDQAERYVEDCGYGEFVGKRSGRHFGTTSGATVDRKVESK